MMASLAELLAKIQGPVGFSSLVHGIISGDGSGLDRQSPVGTTLETARAKLADVQEAQAASTSDFAFWGYQGEVSAWRAAVKILEAAELVGPDDLPDIPPPNGGGVVMDVCAKLEQWGADILDAAMLSASPLKEPGE